MKRILIMSHGNIAQEFKNTMDNFFMSNHQIDALGLEVSDDMNTLIKKLDNLNFERTTEIVVFLDIVSGTPYNVAIIYFQDFPNTKIVSGVNLPMIFVAATSNSFDMNLIIEEGKKSIGGQYDR
ncbi:MAG: PTS sugar transporter subunit IIA [Mycoplasmatales bacterium]